MLDLIKKLREAAAWVVIALVVAAMTFSIVQLILVPVTSSYTLGEAALRLAGSAMGLTSALILLVMVVLCVFLKPSSPRAPVITFVSAIVVSIGVVVTLAFDVIGLTTALAGPIGLALEVLGSLADIVLKVLVAAALWVLVRGQQRGVVGSPLAANTPSRQPSDSTVAPPPNQPRPATGSGWRSANEAAKGEPPAARGTDEAPRQWRLVMQKRDDEI